MRGRVRRPILILAIIVALVAAIALPVGAAGRHWVHISGNAFAPEAGQCTDLDAGAIYLTGDLEGCLYFFPTWFRCVDFDDFDLIQERGTEKFIGPDGEFDTRYWLEATYEADTCEFLAANPSPDDFPWDKQKTGGCDHRIRGTSGDYKSARGLITFHDVVEQGVGATNFFYEGRVRMPHA